MILKKSQNQIREQLVLKQIVIVHVATHVHTGAVETVQMDVLRNVLTLQVMVVAEDVKNNI